MRHCLRHQIMRPHHQMPVKAEHQRLKISCTVHMQLTLIFFLIDRAINVIKALPLLSKNDRSSQGVSSHPTSLTCFAPLSLKPPRVLGLLSVLLMMVACHDATNVPGLVSEGGERAGEMMDAGGEVVGGDSQSGEEMEGGDPSATGAEIDRELALQVAFIEAEVSPQRTYYQTGETLTLTLKCYDTFGDLVPAPELVFTPRPDEGAVVEYTPPDESIALEDRVAAEVTATLTPSVEGQGAVRVCARRNPDLCGRANYFVDNGPALIELTSPLPDEVIIGNQEVPTVEVAGRVSGHVALYVNEEELATDEEGQFSVTLPLNFGYNTIEVSADDGFRRPLARELRTVLYAPETLEVPNETLALTSTAQLRVPPALLDGPPPPDPPEGEYPTFTDIANTLSYTLSLIDPTPLANTQLETGEPLTLSVNEVSVGTPEIDLIVQDGYLEAFIRLPALTAVTEGRFVLDQLDIGLGGALSVDISAYIALRPEIIGQEIILTPDGVGVALESIYGEMEDPVAQALLDTLTSAFQLAVSNWANTLIQELVSEQLPNALSGQLGSALTLLETLPFDFEDPELGITLAGEIELSLNDDRPLQLSERDGVSAQFDIMVSGPPPLNDGSGPEIPPELNGVPAHVLGEIPWPANNELGLALPLSAFNAALYMIWRRGAFEIDLSDQIPPPINTLVGEVTLSAKRPPLLVDTPLGSPYALALSLEALTLTINHPTQSDPADPSLSDDYRLSIYLPLNAVLDEQGEMGPVLSLTPPNSPIIRVAFSRQGGDRPVIEPTLIERSLSNLILPELENLIADGLSIGIPSIDLDLGGLLGEELTEAGLPSTLTQRPRVSELIRVEDGWLIVSSGLDLSFR